MKIDSKKIISTIIAFLLGGGSALTISTRYYNLNNHTKMNSFIERAKSAQITAWIAPDDIEKNTPVILHGKVMNTGANPISFNAKGDFPDCIITVVYDDEFMDYTDLGKMRLSPFKDLHKNDLLTSGGFFSVDGGGTEEFTINLSNNIHIHEVGHYSVSCRFEGLGLPTVNMDFHVYQP